MQGNSTDSTSVDKSIGNSISYETNSKVRVLRKGKKQMKVYLIWKSCRMLVITATKVKCFVWSSPKFEKIFRIIYFFGNLKPWVVVWYLDL